MKTNKRVERVLFYICYFCMFVVFISFVQYEINKSMNPTTSDNVFQVKEMEECIKEGYDGYGYIKSLGYANEKKAYGCFYNVRKCTLFETQTNKSCSKWERVP